MSAPPTARSKAICMGTPLIIHPVQAELQLSITLPAILDSDALLLLQLLP